MCSDLCLTVLIFDVFIRLLNGLFIKISRNKMNTFKKSSDRLINIGCMFTALIQWIINGNWNLNKFCLFFVGIEKRSTCIERVVTSLGDRWRCGLVHCSTVSSELYFDLHCIMLIFLLRNVLYNFRFWMYYSITCDRITTRQLSTRKSTTVVINPLTGSKTNKEIELKIRLGSCRYSN